MQDSWLSILGSVASVGAAIWAFIEARNASRDATKAEAVKNELIQRRTMVEVSHVYAESSRILKLASQVGPTCTKKSTRGLDVSSIAKSIEEYESQRWIDKQLQKLVPGEYFMITFTLPAQFRQLALRYQRVLYELIIRKARRTSAPSA